MTVTLTSLRCLRWTKYPDQKLDDYSSGPLCPSLQSDETITLVIVLSMHISTSTYSTRVVYESSMHTLESSMHNIMDTLVVAIINYPYSRVTISVAS